MYICSFIFPFPFKKHSSPIVVWMRSTTWLKAFTTRWNVCALYFGHHRATQRTSVEWSEFGWNCGQEKRGAESEDLFFFFTWWNISNILDIFSSLNILYLSLGLTPGVSVSHQAVLSHVLCCCEKFELRATDCVLQSIVPRTAGPHEFWMSCLEGKLFNHGWCAQNLQELVEWQQFFDPDPCLISDIF